MYGYGEAYLRASFEVLCGQSFKDFDVVISDNSRDQKILELCEEFAVQLPIRFYRNLRSQGISANLNNAIGNASGKLIKILFQDDYLYTSDAIGKVVKNFDLRKDTWMVSKSEHSYDAVTYLREFTPKFSRSVLFGVNTISSPSVLTIKNSSNLPRFDENLTLLMDCDYYFQCYLLFGEPKILCDVNVVNRIGAHQVSKSLVDRAMRKFELKYMRNKYSERLSPLDKIRFFLSQLR